jgi:4-amino-4-deoxy-L-arabinose transferase-like glycosyltransferase
VLGDDEFVPADGLVASRRASQFPNVESRMLRRLVSTAMVSSRRFAWPGSVPALAALLLPMFFFLYGLNAFPLCDTNEGLYAEIAREMLATGNYVVPHLNGVPYIEKPPLLYWLCALSMKLLGPTPAAARLVPAGSMVLLCLCLFQFCRRHGNARAGAFASAGLASAVPVALVSHVVLFDPLLTALLGASLLCYLHSYLVQSRRAFAASAFLLALAVLEKGGVALVLAGGTAGLFLLLMRDRAGLRRLLDPVALLVLLLVAGAWHVAAVRMQPGFAWFYFINEHVLRFLGERLPNDYHRGPVWFYLPRLLLMMLPWTPFLLLLAPERGAPVPRERTIIRFCQAAVLFPLLFFSLSAAKADYYLLVAAPGLALWMGVEVARRLDASDRLLALCWGLSLACVLLLLGAVSLALRAPLPPSMLALAMAAALGVVLWGRRFFRQLRTRASRELALLAVALCTMPALAPVWSAADGRMARDSSLSVAHIIEANAVAGQSVFIYRDFEDMFSTLPFYLGHPVPVIDSASRDLQFGCKRDAGSFCIDAPAFRRARARGPVAVVLQASRARDFLAMAGPGRWRAEWVGQKMVLFDVPRQHSASAAKPRRG